MEAQLPKTTYSSESVNSRHTRNTGRITSRTYLRKTSGGSVRSNMAVHSEDHDIGTSASTSQQVDNTSVAEHHSTPAITDASITTATSVRDTPVVQYATLRNTVHNNQVSPVSAHSPRIRPLAALSGGIRSNNGVVYDAQKLLPMAEQLEAARADSRFPNTTTSYTNAQAVIDDFEHLLALEQHVRGSQDHITLYVENVRRIQERDSQIVHDNHDAHVRHTVQGLLRNQDVGEDLHAIVRQAARTASANAVERALANHNQISHSDVVRDISQAVIHTMAQEGLVSDQAVDNIDAILEDVFSVIETRILDATGPLRLNVNRMRDVNDNLHAHDNNLHAHDNNLRTVTNTLDTNLGNNLNNLTTQVGAINTHVGAVGTHVNALSTLMQVMNGTATRTNDQVGQFTQQLNSLQQVTAMLPALIREIVQQILPGAVQTALTQVLAGSLQGANAKASFMVAAQTIAATQNQPNGSDKKNSKSPKKGKKRGFFSRLFKRGGGKKDGEDGASGTSN
ncbi:hypothetical protein PFICI_09369 [Pestalotiopsis fici W106-1]|uniref:Uncharacterized protein n=1 Tax=Pestalotiopsis fici (strain W106-1 / CGMCC3.15140) TaxID=1229662 RepID=W3X2Z0_PESFW|nr:uncharacterized protein PFICI_09369 [Pestalotiopsis fici W106-1]ETS79516.1 hypothetical protein PFICI_09369 [Pestalotiopsis fici W106-1]